MDRSKFRIGSLAILLTCCVSTGFAGSSSYEQLLNDEADEITVDPASANPKQQKLKSRTGKPQQSTLRLSKFESGLYRKYPATYSIYSSLTRVEQREIYQAFKANSDCNYIYNLIIGIATK